MARPGCRRPPVPETELIREAFLLEEELEHAGRGQPAGQRGGLLVRARLPQAVQQVGHAAQVVVGGGIAGRDARLGNCDRNPIRSSATTRSDSASIAAELSASHFIPGTRPRHDSRATRQQPSSALPRALHGAPFALGRSRKVSPAAPAGPLRSAR